MLFMSEILLDTFVYSKPLIHTIVLNRGFIIICTIITNFSITNERIIGSEKHFRALETAERAWLSIYQGADHQNRYCLGVFLMDIDRPWIILGRTVNPIMIPTESHELSGFFGHVVFY